MSAETVASASAGPPRTQLLSHLSQALCSRHYCQKTEEAYRHWIRRYVLFHKMRHPDQMAVPEINAFLTHLAVQGKVSASTQNQALSALLFFYRYVLNRPIGNLGGIVRARRPKRVPVVMTREEVQAVLGRLTGNKWLMACLMYGAGLRLLECLRLRVQDVDFGANQITVRDGKGFGKVSFLSNTSLEPTIAGSNWNEAGAVRCGSALGR